MRERSKTEKRKRKSQIVEFEALLFPLVKKGKALGFIVKGYYARKRRTVLEERKGKERRQKIKQLVR
jgi:hypothetical protein